MLWLKAFHIIGVVAWFAGLFYLPRLYVYHADAQDLISKQRFIIMERRLFIIMTIGASIAILFGASMLIESPAYFAMRWLQSKLLLVLLLLIYHAYCYVLLKDFAEQRNRRSARWFRGFNELPSVFLIAIVILAVVKPF
jgi:putative membrane protein